HIPEVLMPLNGTTQVPVTAPALYRLRVLGPPGISHNSCDVYVSLSAAPRADTPSFRSVWDDTRFLISETLPDSAHWYLLAITLPTPVLALIVSLTYSTSHPRRRLASLQRSLKRPPRPAPPSPHPPTTPTPHHDPLVDAITTRDPHRRSTTFEI